MNEQIEADIFRQVMGKYPTGVTVVTAATEDGPTAMVIGSFVSISLDPPLVGFLPGVASKTWAAVEQAGSFCVNVMSDQQLELCNAFFRKDVDPFEMCEWGPGDTGAPRINNALATIDCTIDKVVDAGDHVMVFGLVHAMSCADEGNPLIFFGGGYGTFEGL